MKVILTETIKSLGIIGTEVDVKPGYARNYLLPQQKAVHATEANRRSLEQEKAKFELKLAKEKEVAGQMAKRLEGVTVQIPAKVSEENRLYGSVSEREIADALSNLGIDLEKRMVLLPEPLKEVGTYSVPIRIYTEVEPEITVEVVPE
jgi:large subunit ribosomal protein L9